MLTIILFCTYILPHLGSGPLWPIVIDHHATLCKKYMWRNFLFIHNYFGFDKMVCMKPTLKTKGLRKFNLSVFNPYASAWN